MPPEPANVLHEAGLGRRISCPSCGNLVQISSHMTCGRCETDLELMVEIHG